MNNINPSPHVSSTPGHMGNQTLSRLSDFFQNPAPSFVLIASGCRILIASAFGILCRGVSKTSSGSRSCRCSLPELPLPHPSPRRCRSTPSIPGQVGAALLHTVKRIGDVAANLLPTRLPPFPRFGEDSLSLRRMSKGIIVIAVVSLRVSVVVPESSMFSPPL